MPYFARRGLRQVRDRCCDIVRERDRHRDIQRIIWQPILGILRRRVAGLVQKINSREVWERIPKFFTAVAYVLAAHCRYATDIGAERCFPLRVRDDRHDRLRSRVVCGSPRHRRGHAENEVGRATICIE